MGEKERKTNPKITGMHCRGAEGGRPALFRNTPGVSTVPPPAVTSCARPVPANCISASGKRWAGGRSPHSRHRPKMEGVVEGVCSLCGKTTPGWVQRGTSPHGILMDH